MKTAIEIQGNKMRFSHNIPATRRKEEELYRRMLILNLTKGEPIRSQPINTVISQDLPGQKENAIKELIRSFI